MTNSSTMQVTTSLPTLGMWLSYPTNSQMRTKMCSCSCSPQRLQQRPSLLQVSRVEALGEPVIDRRQERTRLGSLALLLPEARQARGRAQLPGFGLLAEG